jgi:predicted ArsR family transcriptional regulator
MDQTTRKLFALLGTDMCGAICERLAVGAAAKTELAKDLKRSSRDIAATLDSLNLAGLVRYSTLHSGGRGRPQQVWELATADELKKLEDYVRRMRRRLIDSKEESPPSDEQ